MGKKVLIAYATAGVGHKKAAMAIYEAFAKIDSDQEVKIIDLLEYSLPWFKKAYPSWYVFLINKAIGFWKILYYFTNIPLVYKLTFWFRKISHLQKM